VIMCVHNNGCIDPHVAVGTAVDEAHDGILITRPLKETTASPSSHKSPKSTLKTIGHIASTVAITQPQPAHLRISLAIIAQSSKSNTSSKTSIAFVGVQMCYRKAYCLASEYRLGW
jgi:hypothetical protein